MPGWCVRYHRVNLALVSFFRSGQIRGLSYGYSTVLGYATAKGSPQRCCKSGLSSNHWWCRALANWRSNSQRVEGERIIIIIKKQITVKLAPEMNLPDEHLRFERHTGQSPYLHCIKKVLTRVLEHCTVDTSTCYTLHLKGRTFVQLTT